MVRRGSAPPTFYLLFALVQKHFPPPPMHTNKTTQQTRTRRTSCSEQQQAREKLGAVSPRAWLQKAFLFVLAPKKILVLQDPQNSPQQHTKGSPFRFEFRVLLFQKTTCTLRASSCVSMENSEVLSCFAITNCEKQHYYSTLALHFNFFNKYGCVILEK